MKKTLKDKAVDVAKEISKVRAGYVCEKCQRSKAQGWQMHGAHIVPVTWAKTAADPDNILCLCAACHSMGGNSSHQNPIPFARWFEEKWPGRYDQLYEKALAYSKNPFPKMDWAEERLKLKGILDVEIKSRSDREFSV